MTVAYDVHDLFLRDYVVAMYLAALGAIQIGASYGGLRGMLFLPHPRAARLLGVLLILGGFVYFFGGPLWENGPWGAVVHSGGVVGRDGLRVAWDTARWSDLPGARSLNDIDGGLSGGSQGIWFSLSAGLALLSTLLISSAINRRFVRRFSGAGRTDASLEGVELLKTSTWASALMPSLRAWRPSWRRMVREEFEDEREWAGLRKVVNWWRSR